MCKASFQFETVLSLKDNVFDYMILMMSKVQGSFIVPVS